MERTMETPYANDSRDMVDSERKLREDESVWGLRCTIHLVV